MRSILAVLMLALVACASVVPSAERRAQAQHLAQAQDFAFERLRTGTLELMAALPRRMRQDGDLSVYIEGDGFAWSSPEQPSEDPTPRNPLGLRLALAQDGGDVAYLGRACQYVGAVATHCPQRYWTDARFAPELIDAYDGALDTLKRRFQAQRLTLVGYSGGATVAALLAARRGDVAGLITVAGNLDHAAWTHWHGLAPLAGSDNPAEHIAALASVAQVHLVGAADSVVPPQLLTAFAERFPVSYRPLVQVQPGFDHQCCWVEQWPRLYAWARRQINHR